MREEVNLRIKASNRIKMIKDVMGVRKEKNKKITPLKSHMIKNKTTIKWLLTSKTYSRKLMTLMAQNTSKKNQKSCNKMGMIRKQGLFKKNKNSSKTSSKFRISISQHAVG